MISFVSNWVSKIATLFAGIFESLKEVLIISE